VGVTLVAVRYAERHRFRALQSGERLEAAGKNPLAYTGSQEDEASQGI
jgi:hypothetical protein